MEGRVDLQLKLTTLLLALIRILLATEAFDAAFEDQKLETPSFFSCFARL